ncbi:MAG: hypothetical protein WCG19_00650 [Chlorobiaceae bacterium]
MISIKRFITGKKLFFSPFLQISALLLAGMLALFIVQTHYAVESKKCEILLNIDDVKIDIEQKRSMLQTLRKESDVQSIAKARALAYMLAIKPSIISSTQEMERVRKLLDVDELHIGDRNGIVAASTIPGHVGYDYASHPESAEFMLAIHYQGFELAQHPQPRADKMMFQYTGVARIDEPGVVQIGYKPERIYKAIEAADISKVTDNWRIGEQGTALITDLEGTIVSSKNRTLIGKDIAKYGFVRQTLRGKEGEFYADISERRSYCVYKVFDDYMIIGWIPVDEMFFLRNVSLMIFFITSALTMGIFATYAIRLERGANIVTEPKT